MAKSEYKWVRAVKGLNERGQGEHLVLMFEFDEAHPNGEATIAGPIPVQVGDTFKVRELLKDGSIEEVSASEAKAAGAVSDSNAARAAELDVREAAVTAREAEVERRASALDTEAKRLEKLTKNTPGA